MCALAALLLAFLRGAEAEEECANVAGMYTVVDASAENAINKYCEVKQEGCNATCRFIVDKPGGQPLAFKWVVSQLTGITKDWQGETWEGTIKGAPGTYDITFFQPEPGDDHIQYRQWAVLKQFISHAGM